MLIEYVMLGTGAQILGKEGKYAILRLASWEVRKILLICRATIGTVGNEDYNLISRGKAGRTIDGLVLNLLFEDILWTQMITLMVELKINHQLVMMHQDHFEEED